MAGLDQTLLDAVPDGLSMAGQGSRLGSAAGGTDTAAALSQAGCPGVWPPCWLGQGPMQGSKERPGALVVLGSCLRKCCGLGTELSWSS